MPADGGIPQGIETAPKDGRPIVGFCVHEADPYFDYVRNRLTDYGCHCEGLGHVPDGWHVIEWVPERWESEGFENPPVFLPGWWFRSGSEGEEVANPTRWLPIPLEADSPSIKSDALGAPS